MTEFEKLSLDLETPDGRLSGAIWNRDALTAGSTPIILFHESLGSVASWRNFPKKLAEVTGRPVIAYDRLGFGQSDARIDKLPVSFVTDEAASVIPTMQRVLSFSHFIACGHSIGGGMAVGAASIYPKQCKAVITMGAQAYVEDCTIAGILKARDRFRDTDALERLARFHGDKTRWVVDAWIDTWLDPAFADWSLDRALGGVECPVLAIHGESDEYGSAEHPKLIAGAKGRAVILPKIGHIPHREAEAEVLKLIADFLNTSLRE